jgi:hypothetical protein
LVEGFFVAKYFSCHHILWNYHRIYKVWNCFSWKF